MSPTGKTTTAADIEDDKWMEPGHPAQGGLWRGADYEIVLDEAREASERLFLETNESRDAFMFAIFKDLLSRRLEEERQVAQFNLQTVREEMRDMTDRPATPRTQPEPLTSADMGDLAEALADLQGFFVRAAGDLPSCAEDARLLISVLNAEAPGWRGAVLRTGQIARRIR